MFLKKYHLMKKECLTKNTKEELHSCMEKHKPFKEEGKCKMHDKKPLKGEEVLKMYQPTSN